MSRFYQMNVEISGYAPEKAEEIQAAAEAEWPFQEWWCGREEPGETMRASAQDNLCAGESEEEFTEHLSLAVWRANGGYCSVTVDATYLDNLPYETHTLERSDYDRLIQGNTGRNER